MVCKKKLNYLSKLSAHRYALLRQDNLALAWEANIQGRENEILQAQQFLENDQIVLTMQGPGGVGKTRLAFEIGTLAELQQTFKYSVYWVNENFLSYQWNDFLRLQLGKKVLICIDDPKDIANLETLIEACRAKNYKLLIVSRYQNSPVNTVLMQRAGRSSIFAPPIKLRSLTEAQAIAFANNLLTLLEARENVTVDKKDVLAYQVAQASEYIPIWIAIQILVIWGSKRASSLSTTPRDVAQNYTETMVQRLIEIFHVETASLKHFLFWFALLGSVGRSDKKLLETLAQKAHLTYETTQQIVSTLVSWHFISNLNNQLSIKPDVIREYILSAHLIDVSSEGLVRPSTQASQLVSNLLEEEFSLIRERILLSLARLELTYRMQTREVNFLGALIIGLKSSLDSPEALETKQYGVSALLDAMVFTRPRELVEFIQLARTHNNEFLLTRAPYLLYEAAHYARESYERSLLLSELLNCIDDDERFDVHNTTIAEYIEHILFREHGFASDATPEAAHMGEKMLYSLNKPKRIPQNTEKYLMALLKPQLSIEREDMYASAPDTYVIEKSTINNRHPIEQYRLSFVTSLWRMVDDTYIHVENRLIAWSLIDHAHNQVFYGGHKAIEQQEYWTLEIKKHLLHVHRMMKKHHQNPYLSVEEVTWMRRIWDWHEQYETDQEMKQLAKECESLFFESFFFALLKPLLNLKLNFYGQVSHRAAVQAAKKVLGTITSIEQFNDLIAGIMALGNRGFPIDRFVDFCYILGRSLAKYSFIHQFVRNSLENPELRKFAYWLAYGYLTILRKNKSPQKIVRFVNDLIAHAHTLDSKILLFQGIYSYADILSNSEKSFLVDCLKKLADQLDDKANANPLFTALAWSFLDESVDSESLITQLISHLLQRLSPQNINKCLASFVPQYFLALATPRTKHLLTREKVEWGLKVALQAPDISIVIHQNNWHCFGLVFKLTGYQLNSERILSLTKWRLEIYNAFKEAKLTPQDSDVSLDALNQRSPEEIKSRLKERWETPFKLFPYNIDCMREAFAPMDLSILDRDREERTLNELLNLGQEHASLARLLPDILHRLDPAGEIVPNLLVKRIQHSEPTLSSLTFEVGMLSNYERDGDGWRNVAITICQLVDEHLPKFLSEEKDELYSLLLRRKPKRVLSPMRKKSDLIQEESRIKQAQNFLNNEENIFLKDLWAWNLAAAQDHYRARQAQIHAVDDIGTF